MGPSLKKLLVKLHDMNAQEQVKAIQAIAESGNPEGVEEILELLTENADYDVQIESIKALGSLQDTRAGETLLAYLDQEDVPILMETVLALGKLCEIGFSKALTPLEEMMSHSNYRVRKFTIDALSRCGADTTVELLFNELKKEDLSVEMREQITSALGQIGGSRAIEILKYLLFPSDIFPKLTVEVRRAAIHSLGQNKSPAALEVLGKIYNDKDEPKVIRKYAEDAIKMTVDGAKEYYIKVRQRAEHILKGK